MTKSTPLIVLAACLGLPPVGAWLAGRPLAPLYRFPPPLALPAYPRFSWWAVGMVVLVSLAIAWPWLRRWNGLAAKRAEESTAGQPAVDRRPFPAWGWCALGWTLLWWLLAWTRFEWFAWGQRYTFTPLWLGFIVAVNALTWRRRGTCLLTREPARLGRLFAASAVFWWGFEYLNRFVRNWHYLGAEGVGALEYAGHASVCFSTVLPAVASVREWLGTFPGLTARLAAGPAWRCFSTRSAGPVCLLAALGGLVLTGAQPVYCYAALWSAPLLLMAGLALIRGDGGWWRQIAAGDWRDAGAWALAAGACGLFWELWNVHSLAKWVYTVPFVQRWQVFEMPLLGYAGYLTFGLECAVAVAWVGGGSDESRSALNAETSS